MTLVDLKLGGRLSLGHDLIATARDFHRHVDELTDYELLRLHRWLDGASMTDVQMLDRLAQRDVVEPDPRDPLTFDEVSAVSRRRAERWHPGFPNDTAWSGADWSNAMCGEAGEAANVVKKLRRIETGAALGPMDPPESKLRQALADELADVYLYLDLLAAKYDIDLPAAVVSKFNRVSERQGFPDRLPARAPRS